MQTITISDTIRRKNPIHSSIHHTGTTDRIDRILNKHNIRTIFKSSKKIGQILRNPKDQSPPQEYTKYLVFAGKYWRNQENDQSTDKRTPT